MGRNSGGRSNARRSQKATPGCRARPRLERALVADPARRLRVIAITGTSGKTTSAWLTAGVLAEAGLRVGVLSDLGCLGPDDHQPVPADLSRPGTIRACLARLAATGCSHVVVEVSITALAAGVLAGLPCDTLVVTNLAAGPGSRRGLRTIATRGLASLAPGGCLVSGLDPARLRWLAGRLPSHASCLTAGLTEGCDVRAAPVEAGLFGRTVLASCGGQLVPLTLDTPVVPFVRDCLLAAAVGSRSGIPLEVATRGLAAVGRVPGRVERLDRGQEAAVFLDQPTSGHALSATLASLRRLTGGRLAVIADDSLVLRIGGDEFGPLVARHCDACVLVPAGVLDDEAGEGGLAAYARIDRLLASFGRDDCVLVLGDRPADRPPLGDPPAGRFPLALLIDGWLQLALDDRAAAAPRAA